MLLLLSSSSLTRLCCVLCCCCDFEICHQVHCTTTIRSVRPKKDITRLEVDKRPKDRQAESADLLHSLPVVYLVNFKCNFWGERSPEMDSMSNFKVFRVILTSSSVTSSLQLQFQCLSSLFTVFSLLPVISPILFVVLFFGRRQASQAELSTSNVVISYLVQSMQEIKHFSQQWIRFT